VLGKACELSVPDIPPGAAVLGEACELSVPYIPEKVFIQELQC
jgi:hypothetical protein